MSQESSPWERKAKHRRVAKKSWPSNRAEILQSGLLTIRRSAQFHRFLAAFVMLPTETEGAVMVAVESRAGEVFIGQPGYPVATLNELAREADAARRERQFRDESARLGDPGRAFFLIGRACATATCKSAT